MNRRRGKLERKRHAKKKWHVRRVEQLGIFSWWLRYTTFDPGLRASKLCPHFKPLRWRHRDYHRSMRTYSGQSNRADRTLIDPSGKDRSQQAGKDIYIRLAELRKTLLRRDTAQLLHQISHLLLSHRGLFCKPKINLLRRKQLNRNPRKKMQQRTLSSPRRRKAPQAKMRPPAKSNRTQLLAMGSPYRTRNLIWSYPFPPRQR